MTKIEAIKKTIYNLENDVYEYQWTKAGACNCGILARTLLGGKEVWDAGFLQSPAQQTKGYAPFCQFAFCITTNLELPEVFRVLKETGFTIEELNRLENLNDHAIIKKGQVKWFECNDMSNAYRSEKPEVIKYLKAWVEILEEQLNQGTEPSTERRNEVQSELQRADITKQLSQIEIVSETSDKIKTHAKEFSTTH